MNTEKPGQKNEHGEQCPARDCCSPQKIAEMMAKCGLDMKCGCGPVMKGMQEMMKAGGNSPEEK